MITLMLHAANYIGLLHAALISFAASNVVAIANLAIAYTLLTLCSLLIGKRTQVEGFVLRHPTLTLWLRTARVAGLDPWLLVKAVREYLQHELTLQGPTLLRMLKAALRAAFRVGPLAIALSVSGCLSQLHADVEKALVFEQQVQAESIQLKALADYAISSLPADQQTAAREKYTTVNEKLTAALAAKDVVLQGALDATDAQVSLGKLAMDIVDAVDAIMNLLRTFGVSDSQLQGVTARASGLRTTAVVL